MTDSSRHLSRERFPLYLESLLGRSAKSVYRNSVLLTIGLYTTLALVDIDLGFSPSSLIVTYIGLAASFSGALVFLVVIRDKSVQTFVSTSTLFSSADLGRISAGLSSAFNQRHSLAFSFIIGLAGVAHHSLLSMFLKRSLWSAAVDIILVGFFWWFVVASLLWTCLAISYFTYRIGVSVHLRVSFVPIRHLAKCIGELTMTTCLGWAFVTSFGVLTTFHPGTPAKVTTIYLLLAFLIIASTMSVLFLMPLVGFRTTLRRSKKESLLKLSDGLSKLGKKINSQLEFSKGPDLKMLTQFFYLSFIYGEVAKVPEWPVELGTKIRFFVSYVIPAMPSIVAWVGSSLVYVL